MKNIVLALAVGIVLIISTYYFVSSGKTNSEPAKLNNVAVVDGKQIIEIDVKGGYTPKNTVAKAGVPTILRFNTKGTFDCSSSISIPSLDINKVLPSTGSTDFEIGSPDAGKLDGRCGMGMYFFTINFQ